MKKSVIWIAAGAAGIGLGIPAYAAMSPQDDAPRITPAATVVSMPDDKGGDRGDDTVTTAATSPTAVNSTPASLPDTTTANSVEDVSGPCDEAEHANDPRCTAAGPAVTTNTVDDSTHDSVDDSTVSTTSNTVEDVSGPCDEAEHANDPRCAGATSSDDHSGRGSGGHGSDDSSGRRGSDG